MEWSQYYSLGLGRQLWVSYGRITLRSGGHQPRESELSLGGERQAPWPWTRRSYQARRQAPCPRTLAAAEPTSVRETRSLLARALARARRLGGAGHGCSALRSRRGPAYQSQRTRARQLKTLSWFCGAEDSKQSSKHLLSEFLVDTTLTFIIILYN